MRHFFCIRLTKVPQIFLPAAVQLSHLQIASTLIRGPQARGASLSHRPCGGSSTVPANIALRELQAPHLCPRKRTASCDDPEDAGCRVPCGSRPGNSTYGSGSIRQSPFRPSFKLQVRECLVLGACFSWPRFVGPLPGPEGRTSSRPISRRRHHCLLVRWLHNHDSSICTCQPKMAMSKSDDQEVLGHSGLGPRRC